MDYEGIKRHGKDNMILETERLYLREMKQSDYQSLCRILQDDETMYAYEGAFSDAEVQSGWIDSSKDIGNIISDYGQSF